MTQLTDNELIELFDKQLPALLERRPELEPRIYRAFLKVFATKEEVARVLVELREFREEVRQRFEGIDQRLDGVDKRFDGVETRLDRVETRLDGVETRLDRIEKQAEEFRAEVERRFEQVDKRFEQVNQRFEQVDRRFESLEKRMEDGFLELHRSIDRLGSRWGIRNESIFRQTMAELLEKTFGYHVTEREIEGEQFDCVIHNGEHILVEISASVGPDIQERLERKRELYTEATGVVPDRVILVTASIHSHRAQVLREAGFKVIEPEEDKLW